jgi:hypothetical protein
MRRAFLCSFKLEVAVPDKLALRFYIIISFYQLNECKSHGAVVLEQHRIRYKKI